ncbi:uncharacterized protein LOC121530043 [Drosophila eugracilis]|uniref:uncharacterized protein LOC121530043 n=1 Tax=Drosophila eugracilis TaxID=29029 RepID=UPI001BD9B753|nr:uncharacterized protein LOC121530043 [Drosophila eugracilis]
MDVDMDRDMDMDMHVKRLEWNGAESVPGKKKPKSPNSSSNNSSSITNIVIHINTNHKRQGRRFTQLMDLLPLGGLSSSSSKLSTPVMAPPQNQIPNHPSSSISSSLGSPNLSSSQLEVTSAGYDSLRRSVSFHSEELLLDLETGEEFPSPHR